jgi:plasmid maintenance system antidote protein VapI
MVQSQPGEVVHETYLEKTLHKKALVECFHLKVNTLSSNPSYAKKLKLKLTSLFQSRLLDALGAKIHLKVSYCIYIF